MLKRFSFFLLLSAGLLFHSCKNELDLNDDWKEIPVCYGILDPGDTIHYIRIEKGFVGDVNALEAAANPDTVFYNPAHLQVTIEQWFFGQLAHTYTLVADSSIPRDSGIFAGPEQLLYKGIFHIPQDGSRYKLHVKNLHTGKEITAETPIIQSFPILSPSSLQMDLSDSLPIRIKFTSPVFGKTFAVALRFHYTDRFVFDTTQVSEKYVDWALGEQDALTAAGGEQLIFSINGPDFFRYLGNAIPVNTNVERIAGKTEILVSCSTDDFYTYGLVQDAMQQAASDIPPFTNINGGYGLFTSSYTKISSPYTLNSLTIVELRNNPATTQLNFIR